MKQTITSPRGSFEAKLKVDTETGNSYQIYPSYAPNNRIAIIYADEISVDTSFSYDRWYDFSALITACQLALME